MSKLDSKKNYLVIQKKNQKYLKASEERFQRLAEAAFEGICFHEKGVIIDANQQFASMFGYSLDEIKGWRYFVILPVKKKWNRPWLKAKRNSGICIIGPRWPCIEPGSKTANGWNAMISSSLCSPITA